MRLATVVRPLALLVLPLLASPPALAIENVSTSAARISESVDQAPVNETTAEPQVGVAKKFYTSYSTLFYGPSLSGGSVYRPTPDGKRDRESPIFARNYLTEGYNLTNEISLSGTAYWILQAAGKTFHAQDPYLQATHNAYIQSGGFTAYGDLRMHFPVSQESRDRNLLLGLETFHILYYQVPDSRWTVGSNFSAHYHYLGSHGYGDDFELYAAPNVEYRIAPTLSASLMYQLGSSHAFGQQFGQLNNDGTDLEPGLIWVPIPTLVVNPYLSLQTGARLSFATTTVGFYVNWQMI